MTWLTTAKSLIIRTALGSSWKLGGATEHLIDGSLHSRRKRGRGRGSKNAGEGGLGARDEGTPATKTPKRPPKF